MEEAVAVAAEASGSDRRPVDRGGSNGRWLTAVNGVSGCWVFLFLSGLEARADNVLKYNENVNTRSK